MKGTKPPINYSVNILTPLSTAKSLSDYPISMIN
jgi:hypothetical protein